MRWALIVQENNLNLQHIRGKDNVVVDALSRTVRCGDLSGLVKTEILVLHYYWSFRSCFTIHGL